MTEDTSKNRIPEDAIEALEPYGTGWKGQTDWRGKAIRDGTEKLDVTLESSPELGPLMAQLRQMGDEITQQLWHVKAQFEDHERAQDHINEELELTRDRLAYLPPFQVTEPPEVSKARQGVEELRSQLGEEARTEQRRWLETLGEAKTAIAELLRTHGELLGKIDAVSQQDLPRTTLSQLFLFLSEPPSTEIFIAGSPEVVASPGRRIP